MAGTEEKEVWKNDISTLSKKKKVFVKQLHKIMFISKIKEVFFNEISSSSTHLNHLLSFHHLIIRRSLRKEKRETEIDLRTTGPLSLTSIACKTLEQVVCSSVHRYLEAHSILTDAQHGFRKRRSCETQLILTVQDLAKTVDKKGQTLLQDPGTADPGICQCYLGLFH